MSPRQSIQNIQKVEEKVYKQQIQLKQNTKRTKQVQELIRFWKMYVCFDQQKKIINFQVENNSLDFIFYSKFQNYFVPLLYIIIICYYNQMVYYGGMKGKMT